MKRLLQKKLNIPIVLCFILFMGLGLYFRIRFFTLTDDMNRIYDQAGRLIAGMADSEFLLDPPVGGTTEVTSALLSFFGIRTEVVQVMSVALEAIANALAFMCIFQICGGGFACLTLACLTTLPFFGVAIPFDEQLPLAVMLFYLCFAVSTIRHERHGDISDSLQQALYFLSGIFAGIAIFLLPLNLIVPVLAMTSAFFFTSERKRGLKLLWEIVLTFLAAAFVFFSFIMLRFLSTGIFIDQILANYLLHFLELPGSEYLFICLFMVLSVLVAAVLDILAASRGEPVSQTLREIEEEERLIKEKEESKKKEAAAWSQDVAGDGPEDVARPASDGIAPESAASESIGLESVAIKSVATVSVATGSVTSESAAPEGTALGLVSKGKRPDLPKALPEDFVLHRSKRNADGSISGEPLGMESREKPEAAVQGNSNLPSGMVNGEGSAAVQGNANLPSGMVTREGSAAVQGREKEQELEFDFDIPWDDDFDIDVKFDNEGKTVGEVPVKKGA